MTATESLDEAIERLALNAEMGIVGEMLMRGKKELAKTVQQMLDDVEVVTKGRFYEDPEPYASPIEMFLIRDGRPGGETFAQLSNREKLQVLDYYVHWQDHQNRGVNFEQMEQVFRNVIEGKPRAEWLDGTGLDGKPAKDQKMAMKALFEEATKQVKPSLKAKGRDLDMDR